MRDREFLRAACEKGEGCLNRSAIEALAAGVESPAALEHAAQCTFCQNEVAMLREFLGQPESPLESAAVRRIEQALRSNPRWKDEASPAKSGFWAFLTKPSMGLAAASLAAVLALAVWLPRPSSPGPAPGMDDAGVTRSGRVEGIVPIGDLPEAPPLLRWNPVAGAIKYRVRLEEVDQTPVWSAVSERPEASIPEEARRFMIDRKTLYWMVSAEDSQGRAVAVSAPQAFRIVRNLK